MGGDTMHGTVRPEPEEQTMRRPTDGQIEYSPKIGLPLGVYGKRKKANMMRRLPYASAFPQALKALAPHGTMCTINTRARLGERKRSATSGFIHWKSINQQCGAPDSSIGGATCGPRSQTTRPHGALPARVPSAFSLHISFTVALHCLADSAQPQHVTVILQKVALQHSWLAAHRFELIRLFCNWRYWRRRWRR
jgi:hypothetical protein